MGDEFLTAEQLIAPLPLRQVHDTNVGPRAETVALYMLCGNGRSVRYDVADLIAFLEARKSEVSQ